jgi:hypothetical protein
MYAEKSGPYQAWGRVGHLIRRDIELGKVDRKKGFVCVSAHWESDDTEGKVIEGTSACVSRLGLQLDT